MEKREIFGAKKEQGEKQLKEIREAAKSADSDAKLAEKKDAIEAIKVKTRGKLKELKASKRTRYSMAKKKRINAGTIVIKIRSATSLIVHGPKDSSRWLLKLI
ncbi:hypothetical protein [Lacticaseibacillus rhamnosus]|uniref:hypothetical protein n=1 Tax=Lacticaseibacillus rhamnosus TaxID=47715 RepID=UPI0029366667|nr:hypothetical protein [Lacticaseibacillus rhamnosus]MDV2624760.1 hypothetical protein [Lacticaseibacillus rhamnosus]